MSFVLQALIVLLFGLFIYYLWSQRRFYKAWYQLPGPLGLPFIGIGLKVINPVKHLKYLAESSKLYKSPYITWMGPKCFLFVNDPITMEFIMNSPNCINKGDFYNFISDAVGDGILTSSSPRWNKNRRLMDPAFGRPVINDFIPIFNAEADVVVEKLRTASGPIDITKFLRTSVLEASCHTTMGKKMNFSSQESQELYQSFNGITEVLMERMLAPWFYSDFIYQQSKLYKLQEKYVKVIFAALENLINPDSTNKNEIDKRALNCVNGDDDDDEIGIRRSKAIFIEQVRNCVQQGHLTWDNVLAEATITIAATFDTVSTTLFFTCLCLAVHPEYQEKLYEELVDIFPDNNNIEVTQEHLARMTYVEMVINEAMRLFAPIAMVIRNVSNDTKLPNDVTIPKGTQVLLNIFNMHRSEEVWGPTAKQFNPELHFGEGEQSSLPLGFAPFARGPRVCIGTRYALVIMKIFVAKIFRNFILRTDANLNDLVIRGTIIIKLVKYPLFEVINRDK